MAKRIEGAEKQVSRSGPRASALQEFNPDYGYVRADLRRIAILAGVFISLLVILSFVID